MTFNGVTTLWLRSGLGLGTKTTSLWLGTPLLWWIMVWNTASCEERHTRAAANRGVFSGEEHLVGGGSFFFFFQRLYYFSQYHSYKYNISNNKMQPVLKCRRLWYLSSHPPYTPPPDRKSLYIDVTWTASLPRDIITTATRWHTRNHTSFCQPE